MLQWISFHMSLLQFGCSSDQPAAKKERKKVRREKKSKSNMKKREETQKWQDSCIGGSFMMRQRTKCSAPHVATMPWERGIGDHYTSLDAQPSSWRETLKGPLCMNPASRFCRQRRTQAKLLAPYLWSLLYNSRQTKWFCSSKQHMPLLRRRDPAWTSSWSEDKPHVL